MPEDNVSHKRHVRLLKTEYAKVLAFGSELMQLTYSKKQSEINSTSVSELTTNYPFLQVYEEVSTYISSITFYT